MRKIYSIVLAISMPAFVFAQQDSTQVKELTDVVITGQYKPQTVKHSVYQVRTISKERIQQQGASKLQDVLNNELNMRFTQDVATGGSGITMMGLSGQNVKILLDGVPMIGRQGFSNEININQVDINSIERIEIVEGPMSVVYGADALAGVINIITKKARQQGFVVTASAHEETIGSEYGFRQGIHNQYAGLTWHHKEWEIGGGFGHNFFGGWKDTAIDRELVWHNKDQLTGNGFIAYHAGKWNLRYRFDGLDEIIYNPGNFIIPYPEAGDSLAFDQEYLTNRLMQQVQGSYTVNNNLVFHAQAAYTDYSRQVYSTNVSLHTKKVTAAAPSEQSIDEFKGFTLRGSAYYKLSPLVSFQPGLDINLDNGKGQRLKAGTNKINDYAFYVTAELTPSAKINIRPGLRFIQNSVYDAPPVIPSVNTKIVLTDHLDLRLSYARGFRSPSLRELYFNFIDANHLIIGNPDLKAETSHSINGSVSWDKKNSNGIQYKLVAGGFYNTINNKIDYAYSTTDTIRLLNIAKGKTAGTTLTAGINWQKWSIEAGAGYTGFYNNQLASDNSLPALQWSAEANAVISYQFSSIGLNANLYYKYTGKRPFYTTMPGSQDIVLSRQEGYHMADFTINKSLFGHFNLNAGIRNLFDVKQINSSYASGSTHSSEDGTSNIAYGRSYFAGLVFNWNHQ